MDIYQNIKKGMYKTIFGYPKRPHMICRKCGKIFAKDHKFCRECGANIQHQFEAETESYKIDLKTYREESKKKDELFKKHAIEYVGLKPGKIAELVYSKAHEDGNSEGDHGIVQELEEITDFMDELKKAGF